MNSEFHSERNNVGPVRMLEKLLASQLCGRPNGIGPQLADAFEAAQQRGVERHDRRTARSSARLSHCTTEISGARRALAAGCASSTRRHQSFSAAEQHAAGRRCATITQAMNSMTLTAPPKPSFMRRMPKA